MVFVGGLHWNEVNSFIEKLNKLYNSEFRLPTAEEWEYAAKGGNDEKNSYYSGNNYLDKIAWFADNSEGKTRSVGSKEKNEIGLFDMSGNVAEWCSDWYKSYPGCGNIDLTGSVRVIRGGSWNSTAEECLITHRQGGDPNRRYPDVGFRLAVSVIDKSNR
jgi:formylglycine-generating enzyme required for sulfatase activity